MSDRLINLVAHILSKPERRWIEHKADNSDPQRIGRYVSALSNSAALDEEPFGYLIWGIEDGTKKLLGTDFDPFSARRGNQSLEFWLAQQTDPNPPTEFFEIDYEGFRLVLMKVSAWF